MWNNKSASISQITGKLSFITSFASVFCFFITAEVITASSAISQSIDRRYFAQTNTETTETETTEVEATPEEETVTETTEVEATPEETVTETTEVEATPKETVTETETAADSIENEIISELNRVRTNPEGYAAWLEEQKQYYQGMLLKLPGEQPIRTNRGLRSLEEAITFLRQQNALPALSTSTELTSTAREQIADIVNAGQIKNRNNLVYGKVTPEAIVMQLVVDDGFPDRRHRKAIFNSSLEDTGIACSEIPIYTNVCAIALNTTETAIAQQPTETTSAETASDEAVESNNTNSNDTDNNSSDNSDVSVEENNSDSEISNRENSNGNLLPTPPPINTPLSTPSDNTATTETEVSEAETPTPESKVATTSEESNDTISESEVSEVETPTPESEADTTPEESNTVSNPETEVSEAETPTPESEVATTLEESNAVSNPETKVSEVETPTPEESNTISNTETEVSEVETPTSESEVATNSNIDNTSQVTETIEKGILEEGDDVIPNDGSFYDSYPLEGSAGDSFVITLESSDFDTFLAIMDRDGNIIEQNDDLNEEDSNSRLEITLSDNGTYSVIVNAYNQGGKGNYTLKISQ